MSKTKTLIRDYNEFYSQSDWKTPELGKGIARVKLYFKMASLYEPGLARRGLRVLDVGCGTGFYTYCLHQAGYHADGLDYSEVAVQKACEKWGDELTFFRGDGNDLSHLAGQYDLIFARGLSLYNTCDPQTISTLTNHYLSVLRPGGSVMVIVSTDLSGTNLGWVNCTYAQFHQLFRGVEGKVTRPLFFDYWLVRLSLRIPLPVIGRSALHIMHTRPVAETLAWGLRRVGARIPTMFVATRLDNDLELRSTEELEAQCKDSL